MLCLTLSNHPPHYVPNDRSWNISLPSSHTLLSVFAVGFLPRRFDIPPPAIHSITALYRSFRSPTHLASPRRSCSHRLRFITIQRPGASQQQLSAASHVRLVFVRAYTFIMRHRSISNPPPPIAFPRLSIFLTSKSKQSTRFRSCPVSCPFFPHSFFGKLCQELLFTHLLLSSVCSILFPPFFSLCNPSDFV